MQLGRLCNRLRRKRGKSCPKLISPLHKCVNRHRKHCSREHQIRVLMSRLEQAESSLREMNAQQHNLIPPRRLFSQASSPIPAQRQDSRASSGLPVPHASGSNNDADQASQQAQVAASRRGAMPGRTTRKKSKSRCPPIAELVGETSESKDPVFSSGDGEGHDDPSSSSDSVPSSSSSNAGTMTGPWQRYETYEGSVYKRRNLKLIRVTRLPTDATSCREWRSIRVSCC